MNNLKPCPCCGGKAVLDSDHVVYCGSCFLQTDEDCGTDEQAAAAWNRRVGEKELREGVEKMIAHSSFRLPDQTGL